MSNPLASIEAKINGLLDAQAAIAVTPPELSEALGVVVTGVVELVASFSSGVSFSLGFSADITALFSAVAELEVSLSAFNRLAAGAGGGVALSPEARAKASAAQAAAARLSSQVANLQRKVDASGAGTPVDPITAEIRMPRIGPWHADIAVAPEKRAVGKVRIKAGGLEFVGTVVPERTGLDGSRAPAHVVGGAGGFSTRIGAKSYVHAAGVRVETILNDLLRETGETLSPTADAETLARRLYRWHRAEGLASEAMTDLADAVQCAWRVLRDGTVWIGPETWPEAELEYVVLNEDWSQGVLTIAPEAPELVPGTTLNGMRVEQVVHTLGGKLRTEAHATAPNLSRRLSELRRKVDYARLYPSTVALQNEDGTLQLLPDDPVMRARGLDKIKIRHGLPGVERVVVQPGARVMLGFDNGDPAKPFATSWDEGGHSSVSRIEIGQNAVEAARKGDSVEVPLPPAVFSGTIGGAPASGVLTFPVMKTVGVVTSGTPKVRLGT